MSSVSHDEDWKILLVQAADALQAGDRQRAKELYDAYIKRDPHRAEAFFKRAVVLSALGSLELALADYDHAIALNPRYGYAFCNRGSVLERMGRKEDAVRSYDMAISINPGDFLAFYNRGTVLQQLGRPHEALACFDHAVRLNPEYAEAYVNRGNVLQELWRHEDALTSFDKAIQLKPVFAEAFQGRGTSLHQLKRFEPALASFTQALALNPQQKFVAGARRLVQMQMCDWDDWYEDVQRLVTATEQGVPVAVPLAMLALRDAPPLHRISAETWIRSECSAAALPDPFAPRYGNSKIRIAYFSADFREHPVAQLTAEIFEHHDKEKFEITAFALGPPGSDAMRARLERSFDRFIDVRAHSDHDVAMLARRLETDIAVDLGGLTEHSRTRIFAHRAAPIQINYLGYPGTMGAEFMDYVIADPLVVPPSEQGNYSEKVIYLPNGYLPADSIGPCSARVFVREELGLPESGFVFCCFNNVHKMTPSTFHGWMRVLKQVEGSVLWLGQTNAAAAKNLWREAALQHVAPERLIFAERIDSLAEHRARLGVADLFLDTFPYNAHATALDALWAGLPIVTRIGESYASRVAASLLLRIGLPELIASNSDQYEQLATELARSPRRIADVKARLRHSLASTPLCDIQSFTADLETAYSTVFQRYLQGLLPDHMYVES